MAALSGPASAWGIVGQVEKLQAEAINDLGGIRVGDSAYKIELILEDDQYSAEGARAAIEKLLYDDKVDFVAGSFNTAGIRICSQICTRKKVLFVGGGTPLELVTPATPYYFRACPITSSMALIGKLAQSKYSNIKRVAVLASDDS